MRSRGQRSGRLMMTWSGWRRLCTDYRTICIHLLSIWKMEYEAFRARTVIWEKAYLEAL